MTKRFTSVALAAFLLATPLVACGPSDPPTTLPAPSPSPTTHSTPAASPTASAPSPTASASPSPTQPEGGDGLIVGAKISEDDLLAATGFAEPPTQPDLRERGDAAGSAAGQYYYQLWEYAIHRGEPGVLDGDIFVSCRDCQALQDYARSQQDEAVIQIRENVAVDVTGISENPQNPALANVDLFKSGGRLITYDRQSQTIVAVVPNFMNVTTSVIGYSTELGWIPVVLALAPES